MPSTWTCRASRADWLALEAMARQIVSQLSQLGEGVTLISKTHCSVQNLGLGAQTADHWVRRTIRAGRCSLDWLIIEEVTQLDVGLWADIAELSTNRRVCSGTFDSCRPCRMPSAGPRCCGR